LLVRSYVTFLVFQVSLPVLPVVYWLSVAGTSTCSLPNGPFAFNRTFLPDGNATVDFTILKDDDGTAFLARTFYSNLTYVVVFECEAVKLPLKDALFVCWLVCIAALT
jgi:hypothetical protein